jgi:hypothetical protein
MPLQKNAVAATHYCSTARTAAGLLRRVSVGRMQHFERGPLLLLVCCCGRCGVGEEALTLSHLTVYCQQLLLLSTVKTACCSREWRALHEYVCIYNATTTGSLLECRVSQSSAAAAATASCGGLWKARCQRIYTLCCHFFEMVLLLTLVLTQAWLAASLLSAAAAAALQKLAAACHCSLLN